MSLTGCIAKAGSTLSDTDKTAILIRAAELRQSGAGTDAAGRQAVGEQLSAVSALLEGHGKPAAPPAGYKAAGEPYFKDDVLTQPYAHFAPGERVRDTETRLVGAVDGLMGDGPMFDKLIVKFDNGTTQTVPGKRLEAEGVVAPARPAFSPKVGDAVAYRQEGQGGTIFWTPATVAKINPETGSFVLNDGRFAGGVQSFAQLTELADPATVTMTRADAGAPQESGKDRLERSRDAARSDLAIMQQRAEAAGAAGLASALQNTRITDSIGDQHGNRPPAYIQELRGRFEKLLERALANPGDEFADIRRGALPSTKALTPAQAAEIANKRLQAAAAAAAMMNRPGVSEPDAPYGDNPARPTLTREQESQVLPIISAMMEAAVDEGLTAFADVASRTLADFKEMVPGPFSDALTIQHLQGAYISLSSRYSSHGLDGIMAVAAFTSRADLAPKETDHVPDSRPPVEPDRPTGSEPGVAPPNGDGPGAVEPGGGSTGRGAASGGGGSGRGTRVHRDRAAVPGESGRAGFPDQEPAVDGIDPQGGNREGRSDAGDLGAPPEPGPDQETLDFADRSAPVSGDRAKAQREAERAPVIPGDAENISATLPMLLPLQQTDVLFAETRFGKEDGYGVLFTNGTGTGKTFVGLGVVKRYVRQGKKNILIVAPSAEVINGWVKAAPMLGLAVTRLASTKDAGSGVVITTYANLRANSALINRKWDLLVSDEAQNLNQNADGDPTDAADNFRGLSMHPDSAGARARMKDPDLSREIDLLNAEVTKAVKRKDNTARRVLEAKLAPLLARFRGVYDAQRDIIEASQGLARPRALFLSATPFAYEKSIRWAQHYLFDWSQGHVESGAYNAGGAYEQFMMRHLGYRMRTGLLNEPDERRVDRGLLQRNFNTWLKSTGVLAGRMLEVEPDYDRKFIAAQSGIGVRIDQGFSWFHDTDPAALGVIPVSDDIDTPEGRLRAIRNAMGNVRDALNKRFDYHTRMRLLEALKAQAAAPYIQAQMDLGRKVIVFHDLIKGQTHDPFGVVYDERENPTEASILERWKAEFDDLVSRNWNALKSPIETMMEAFSPDVALLNGTVTGAARARNLERFNSDDQGPMVLVVQSALEAGWSGHDTTGKYPRVLVNLGLPVTPTRSIQQEGRIYRVGQQSNAMFRYLNTQTSWEMQAFANTIARRASTAENLAMGEDARGLLASYVEAFEQTDDWAPGHDGEGTGGKARDRELRVALTDWDKAKTLYWSKIAKTSKTKALEGSDWFATPEPLGMKMVQWGDIRPDEQTLEPSAGDGSIARWMPDNAKRTAIEPSPQLAPRLALVFDGTIRNGTFEQLHITNKADVVVMNPPFGKGGKLAIEHLAKAFNEHLDVGGRVVALIPEGAATEARLDKFLNGKSDEKIKPIYMHPTLGPVYRGDIVEHRRGTAGRGDKVVRMDHGGMLMVHPSGPNMSPGYSMGINPDGIDKIEPTGARTQIVPNSVGAHVVATIRLPSDAFGRAGTQVMTRIVIIDKLALDAAGPAPVAYDLSRLETVEELFDAIEHLEMPGRTKERAVDSEDDAPAPVAGQTGAVDIEVESDPKAKPRDSKQERTDDGKKIAAAFGLTITPWTTGKGNQLEGVILAHVTLAQAKEFDKYAWPMKGGVYTRIWELNDLLKKYPLPHVAQEERAVYAVNEPDANYDIDLFGDPTPVPSARGAVAAAKRSAAARGVDDGSRPSTLSVRADPHLPGIYHVTTQLVEVGQRKLPVTQVTNWGEAAAALSALSRFAVEHFDALVTDGAGKPLALVGGFKGAISQTAVFPSALLAEALRIQGAHAVWGVHNHPSGSPELSSADTALSSAVYDAFKPSRVKWMGLAAVGSDGAAVQFSAVSRGAHGQTIEHGTAASSGASMVVPIVERAILRGPQQGQKAIDSPEAGKAEIARMMAEDTRPGILFLSAQHAPTAWVPVDPDNMASLNGTGEFDRLINSATNAGAGAAIIANPGGALTNRVAANIASALSMADVKLMDVIDPVAGTSARQQGTMPSANLPILSGITDPVIPGGVPVKDLRAAVSKAVDQWVWDGYGPTVEVVATPQDLPPAERAALESMNSLNGTRGLIMPDGRVFLIADHISSVAEGLATLFHETYGHFGLRAFLGDSYETQMGVLRMANPKLAAEANAWYALHGQNQINAYMESGLSAERAGAVVRALAVEEALADRAGENLPPKAWKLLLARLMKALRDMGMGKVADWLETKTEAETHTLLMRAREMVVGDPRMHVNHNSDGIAGERTSKSAGMREKQVKAIQAEKGRGDGASLQPGGATAAGTAVRQGRFDARETDGPAYEGGQPLLSQGPPANRPAAPATLRPSSAWIDTAFRVGMAPVAKLTSPSYTHAIQLADGLLSAVPGGYWEYIKAGMVDQYGLDPRHAEAKIALQTAIRVNARKVGEIVDKLRVLDASQSRIAYLWASTKTEDAAAARALFDQLPEEPKAILQSLRDDIVHLGHEAVALGLITEEVRAANEFAYMHRSYEKYELEDANAKAARQRAISIIGDEFKERGMRDDAPMSQIGTSNWWERKTNGTASDPSLKGREFHRLELRALPDVLTPELFEDENGKPMGKIREITYWPVDEPIPAKYADWRNDGVWRARWFNNAGRVGMFRDFTLAERTKLGEIQEIKYSTAVTMLQMVRDVETARFLDWVARNESLPDASQLPAGAKTAEAYNTLLRSYTKDEWVQVPDGKIKGTDVKRYGNLAGRWVAGPVWNDIRQISQLNAQDEMTQEYNKLMRLWKVSKALALDTPIPTPSGWTTMGEIKVGDQVFDEQGKVCEVLGATPVQLNRKCYRVEFSDGTSIVADAEHLWFTIRRGTPGVRNTEEILATLKERTRGDANHKIPVAGELALEEANLPLAPYVLGAWLGDGDTRAARITAGVEDVTELRQHLVAAGVRCAPSAVDGRNGVQTFQVQRGGAGCIRGHDASKSGPSGCWQCCNEKRAGKQPKIVDQNIQVLMRGIGLLGNKHIPAIYLRGSAAQRRELLQGLMDTDGNITEKGLCSFATSLAPLRDGMLELLRSLGHKPSVTEWQPTCNGKPGKTAWRIHFKAYADKPVFKMARKNCRLAPLPANKQRSQSRQIVAITPVASVPVRCIAVSSKSRLYLAGAGMVPTHNTALSPVTHMNNVMSNFMIADMHDIQARHIHLALKAWTYGRKDPAMKRLMQDYQDNGGDAGKFNESEIRNELFEPLLEELRQQIEQEAGGVSASMTAASVIDLLQHRQFRQALGAVGKTRAGQAAAWVPKKMMKLYGVEDEVFRLAAFIKARQDGLNDHDAGAFARHSFLNYDITAPWVNAMRRTVWPFFAFSYRAVPMMLKLAADKPHKLAKYWALGGVLNTMAYGMGSGLAYFSFGLLGGGGDEDEERAYMPDDKSGRIWGFLGPKLIRMPWGDKNKNPVFLDIRRWIPAGDIVDTGQSHSALPLPPPLIPGGPLMLMAEFALNSSGFTGKGITDPEIDTPMERIGKAADWAWKGIMPNNPVIPWTYSQQNLIETMNGRVATGTSGDEKASLAQAALSAFGVKVGSYPIETLESNENLKVRAQNARIHQTLTQGMRAIQNSGEGVSDEDKDAARQKLMDRALGKLNARQEELAAKREKAGR